MTILHFSSATSWRGGEQQIAYLIEELMLQSVEQMVLCVAGAPLAAYCKSKNIPFETYAKRSSIDPRPARLMAQICTSQKIDLVHMHDSHAHTYACMATSFFGVKVPLVLSRRVDFAISKNPLSSWKYNHSAIKVIICVSQFIKSVIQPRIQEYKKIKVVHSGIDLSRFQYPRNDLLRKEFNIATTAPLIVNVAAIAPHKDYFTFVDTAELILHDHPDARFLMIGADGGEADAVRQHLQRRQLSEYIKFTGFRKDISEVLPGADVFLFTSKEEGLGTSLLDALACKVPVVATQAGGVPEIIKDEKTGLLAPVKDVPKLAKQVHRILKDKDLRARLISGGLDHLKAFAKQTTAAKTLEIYRKILKL